MNLEEYSVIKSRHKVFERDSVKFIRKEIRLNVLGIERCEIMRDLMLGYVSRIREVGIPMPKIEESHVKNGMIYFICKYRGKNLVELFEEREASDIFENHLETFKQAIGAIRNAKESDLCLDPHIKNFVIDENGLSYVDFSPPYSKGYNALVLSRTRVSDKEIVEKNLNAFMPDQLGYHFMGDLLKEDKKYSNISPEIYRILLREKLIKGGFDEFISMANKIKDIEIERVERDIYLI